MNLTAAERLALILACQKSGIKQEIDPAFIEAAIVSGNDWAIKWKYDWLFTASKHDNDVKFVCDVLDFFRLANRKKENVSHEDLDLSSLKQSDFIFQGFDGNNESNLLSIAEFFIKEMGLWSEFQGIYLNSHAPMRSIYEQKLDRYRELMRSQGKSPDEVTFDDFRSLLIR
jgi:uncharacterized protein YfbU (UPF0304 family)